MVKEDLTKAKADQNEAVLRQAQALLKAIEKHAPETAGEIGVSLKDIKGALLNLTSRRISATAKPCSLSISSQAPLGATHSTGVKSRCSTRLIVKRECLNLALGWPFECVGRKSVGSVGHILSLSKDWTHPEPVEGLDTS